MLTNYPSLFVATVLVGNNAANYATSLATVLASKQIFGDTGGLAPAVLAPLLLAPLLFVYGELLPKKLFFESPTRLLRRCGIPLLISYWLFLPVTFLLYLLSKALEAISGELPQQVQLMLARRELQRVLVEGHAAGILHPAQQSLAQGLLGVANKPVRSLALPSGRVPRIRQGMPIADIRRLARRQRFSILPVEETDGARSLIGYVRAVDVFLSEDNKLPPIRALIEIRDTESHLSAMTRLLASGEGLGHVVDAQGRSVGFVTTRTLSEQLFRGE